MKLSKYEEWLRESGISSLDQLAETEESTLEELKIPLGHKLKLMKKIWELKKEKCEMEPLPA